MRLASIVILSLALAACDDGVSDDEKRAAVEASQDPPAFEIEPQPILYPDIEKHEIYGASCAFVPDGGGLGAIVIAMADAGYMKVDGEVLMLAPDSDSAELPLGAREMYRSDGYSLSLSLAQGEGEQSGYEVRQFDGKLTVTTGLGEVAYQANGLAQCGV